jgi:hypothetical protein
MITAALGIVLLWVVTMRSIMGKASWIRLKPLYSYVSPIGIWFSTMHVIAFGAMDFYTVFNPKYYNGMPTISFLSSMFTACVLVVHHIMALFHTKKICSDDHLWMHSIVNVACKEYSKIAANVNKVKVNLDNLDKTLPCSNEVSECDSVEDFEDYLYDTELRKRVESQTAVPVGVQ